MVKFEVTNDDLPQLIGKNFIHLELNKYKNILKFVTEQEDIYYLVFGDCCSESYIQHISMYVFDKNPKILNCELHCSAGIDMPNSETLEISIYKINLEGGYIIIDLRNESNGYYSGYLYHKEKSEISNDEVFEKVESF